MTAAAKRGPGHPPLAEGERTVRLVAHVPESTKAELEEQAKRLETSAGALVREAVEAHLPRVRRRQA